MNAPGGFAPTPYRVSTITATGSLGTTHVDLDALYERLDPGGAADAASVRVSHVSFVEHATRDGTLCSKGVRSRGRNRGLRARARGGKRHFDNQVTVVLQHFVYGAFHAVNAKVFKNGNVQLTGLKTVEQGDDAVRVLRALVLPDADPDDDAAAAERAVAARNYKVRLINCDFRLGARLRREALHAVVRSEYGTFASFEPCIYPGVKIQYFANERRDGICHCAVQCSGKGADMNEGQCKKITVAVFQSGCVIVTGGQTHAQVDAAYRFICDVVDRHLAMVRAPA